MSKRRGQGEGAIYQRADGRWCAVLDLGYVNSKRRRVVRYAKTRKEAAQKLQELQQQQRSGVNLAAERQTVSEYLAYWHQHHVQQQQAGSTAERYEAIIRLHLAPAIGHIALSRLSAQHIQAMLSDLYDTHASGTLNLFYSVLHTALERAVKLRLIPHNPADAVSRPRPGESPARVIAPEHERAIFATLEQQEHRLKTLFLLAIKIGLRKGELIALCWSDIDFDKAELRVRKGKTPRSRRTISLPAGLVAALRAHWEFQALERLAHSGWQEHGRVFPSTRGTPLCGSNLYGSFIRIQEQSDVPEPYYRFHDLRHTCATRLAEEEVHPRVAMEILGHSNIATTMEIYTHVSNEAQRAALEKLQSGYTVATNEGTSKENTCYNGHESA